ncbi:MAG: hypothetical protein KAU27_03080, partial [Desulfuromonadales bacterium]|nr:hypothetical protein [Desulfuromonadales bacterium]
MKFFSLNEYNELVARSVVLEQDRHGIKVLQTPEGMIVKFFRQKRLLSSALFKSYASRFVDNARSLTKLGIKTVEVEDVLYCKPIKRTLVFYQPVPGQTLRDVMQSQAHANNVMEKFIVFLAELHDKGVFFRSIHLSNIIVSDCFDALGLIDIVDMKINRKGLSPDMRIRNFRHLTRYKVDQESIRAFGIDRFMDVYFKTCHIPESHKSKFLETME